MVALTQNSQSPYHRGMYRICRTVATFLAGFYAATWLKGSPERFLVKCDGDLEGSISLPEKAPAASAQICNQNPYRESLLPGHSFDLAERYAKGWLENKLDVRDAMYAKSYGLHTHDKFDAFEVMAPCNYTCTGDCRADASKIVCGAETLQPGCVIYSIGGNNNWVFEESIYDMTPCEIHTFDCTGTSCGVPTVAFYCKATPSNLSCSLFFLSPSFCHERTGPISRFQPPARLKDRLTFHHVCLSSQNVPPVENPEPSNFVEAIYGVVGAMETLETMQKRLRHTRLDVSTIRGGWRVFMSWVFAEGAL